MTWPIKDRNQALAKRPWQRKSRIVLAPDSPAWSSPTEPTTITVRRGSSSPWVVVGPYGNTTARSRETALRAAARMAERYEGEATIEADD